MPELETKFVLVPRSPSGGISRPGQNLLKEHMQGGRLAFDREEPQQPGALPPKIRKILEEFRQKLPKGIKLDANPFVVVKVGAKIPGTGLMACRCECSATSACGGGGGGS